MDPVLPGSGSVETNLSGFNHAARLLTFCPTGKKVQKLLKEKKLQSNNEIPCPIEVQQEVATSLIELDLISEKLNFIQSISKDQKSMENLITKTTNKLANTLQQLEEESCECDRLDEVNRNLLKKLYELE